MAQRTQVRLTQITGSATDLYLEDSRDYTGKSTVAALTGSDLLDLLGAFAGALERIHGVDGEPFNQTAGTFSSSIFDVNASGAITIDSSGGSISIGADDNDQDINIGTDGTRTIGIGEAADSTVEIRSKGGTFLLDGTGQTVDINSAALDIDASGAITIDGTSTFSVDAVGASNITTHGNLTLSGSDNITLTAREGTTTISNTQGAIDIDAGSTIDIDASSGINIGKAADVAFDIDTAALDIDSSGAITIDGTSTFSVDAVGASNVTTNGALTISGSTGLNLQSDGGEIDITARLGAIDINATAGAVNIDAGSASEFATAAGALTLDGKTGINLQENNATIIAISDDRDVTTTNTRQIHLDASGVVNINSTGGAISIGNDNDNQNINIGTDGTRTITIGENGATDKTVNIHGEAADIVLDAGSNNVAITGGLTVSGDASITGGLAVTGDLDITGDISYQYVTSSVVEYRDPVLLLHGNDPGSGALLTSASFHSAATEVEGSVASYDYGLVFKRSLSHNSANGLFNDATIALPAMPDDATDTPPAGSPFGIFKLDRDNPTVDTEEANANQNATAGAVMKFKLQNHRSYSTTGEMEVLDRLRGAILMLSSSNGAGKRAYGIVLSGSTAENNVVEVQMLGSSETYAGDDGDDTITNADMINGLGSLQLATTLGGLVFNRESNSLIVAASMVTGSGDNNFVSGSSNVLLYGGTEVGKTEYYINDFLSGSTKQGQIHGSHSDGFLIESQNSTAITMNAASGQIVIQDGGTTRSTIDANTASQLGFRTTDANDVLQIKRNGITILDGQTPANSGQLIISKNNQTHTITTATTTARSLVLPDSNGSNGQFLQTDGSGNLSFAAAAGASLNKAVLAVKTEISSGVTGLILTASATAAQSTHFNIIGNLNGNIASEINDISQANLFKNVDLFLNGQLLVSGSKVDNTAPTDGDYVLTQISATQFSGSFAFDLEVDDIITIIAR